MKILSRNFSRGEKILIAVLAIVLVGLAYYRFVYVNLDQSIASNNAEAETLQSELTVVEAKLAELVKMNDEVEAMEGQENVSYMRSYNASREEIDFLNDTLLGAIQYTVRFADVTRKGDQIRRNFTLQFTTNSYQEAMKIIEKLVKSDYRCLVGDIRCGINDEGIVTISTVATFYETMVGGEADSGLPKDSAEKKK